MTGSASDAQVLDELRALGEERGEFGVFRSTIGADQYRELYALFRRFVPERAHVLDWGAGSGHFSYFLQRTGYRAAGYSFNPFSYESILPRDDYVFTSGSEADPVRLPYDASAFDAVASIGVLEHVRETGGNEQASLGEIARVLRPGGWLVCWHFPNEYSWIDLAARLFPSKYVHRWRYTRTAVEKLVGSAGLDLVHVRRYGFLPRNMWARAPRFMRASRVLAGVWNGLDRGLGAVLPWLVQNYAFVARKPEIPSSKA